jgi:PKD repeat protein
MKKIYTLALSLILTVLSSYSIAANVQVTGNITTNTTWTRDNVYILVGFIYVKNNATLTIQAGTTIRGDFDTKGTLIITRGAKIIANGTAAKPIVFTSNQAAGSRDYGDWGGLIILGKAPINQTGGSAAIEGGVDNADGDGQYGGTDPNDNSGVIRYVRIEYAGIAFQPNNEINGLTLGGVGRNTIIEHVQVTFANDDAIECFGGTVNMKNLVLHKNLDDDLDSDNGYQGRVQFVLITRDPQISDAAGASNGFESDNDANGTTSTPQTRPLYSNITLIGPLENSSTTISTYYKRCMHLRRNTATSIYNSVLMGYPTGILIDGTLSEGNATNDLLQVRNTTLAGCTTPLSVNSGSTFDINTWFNTSSYNNNILPNTSDVNLTAPYASVPNAVPANNSPLLNGASFTNPLLSDPFFTPVTYRGAFGSENWAQCWTEFDPSNLPYDGPNGIVANFNSNTNLGNAVFSNSSANATSYAWNFGDAGSSSNTSTDANPTHTYTANGQYTVTLIAINSCGSDTLTKDITISGIVGVNNLNTSAVIKAYPNPVSDVLNVEMNYASDAVISITDISGRVLITNSVNRLTAYGNTLQISTSGLNAGVYFLNIYSNEGNKVLKFYKL